jgi:hypothetical protein
MHRKSCRLNISISRPPALISKQNWLPSPKEETSRGQLIVISKLHFSGEVNTYSEFQADSNPISARALNSIEMNSDRRGPYEVGCYTAVGEYNNRGRQAILNRVIEPFFHEGGLRYSSRWKLTDMRLTTHIDMQYDVMRLVMRSGWWDELGRGYCDFVLLETYLRGQGCLPLLKFAWIVRLDFLYGLLFWGFHFHVNVGDSEDACLKVRTLILTMRYRQRRRTLYPAGH